MDLLEAIATTRAIRRYRPDPVSEEDLATILYAATRAPTGSNRQPFRFLVLRDGPYAVKAKALLKEGGRRMWSGKRTEEGYDAPPSDDSPRARMDRTMHHLIDTFERIPVVVLPCLIRYRPPHPGEGGSIYPACQNLLLAARGIGLGGVITNFQAFVEPELRDLLRIPEQVAISATIPIGHPAGRHGPVRRRPLAELVYDDVWEGEAEWVG